tara:strand:+ start:15085 stop:16158 length:1074 start_codon:yes stop_codon:yes gene_type:complete
MLKKIKNMFNKSAPDDQQGDALTIGDLLHGTQPGSMQSVGLMQVIPLTSTLEDDRFISPMEANVWTEGYGQLSFENPSSQTLLIPTHTGFIVKQKAQDHAMAHAGLIGPKKQKLYKTAMCVQATQGGMISKGPHKMMILPHSLREKALHVRKETNYDKLWQDISQFNDKNGQQEVGDLVLFTNAFKEQLDQFVAEFECVPDQVGAIILLAGQVVGIERAPSVQYWRSIWSALIRECYGSKAIELTRELGKDVPLPETRVPLQTEQVHTLDDLAQALKAAQRAEDEIAKERVRELLDIPVDAEQEDETLGELHVQTIKSELFVGQLVRDKERICYASLINSEDLAKRRKWQKANAFSI